MSRHVVLLRRDPSLGLALRALLHGTGRVTELLTIQAWSALAAETVDAVVIDLPTPRRTQAIDLVRSAFDGRLVLVLDPSDDPAAVPSHHACSIVQRPFEIVELWHLVTTDPASNGEQGPVGRPAGEGPGPTGSKEQGAGSAAAEGASGAAASAAAAAGAAAAGAGSGAARRPRGAAPGPADEPAVPPAAREPDPARPAATRSERPPRRTLTGPRREGPTRPQRTRAGLRRHPRFLARLARPVPTPRPGDGAGAATVRPPPSRPARSTALGAPSPGRAPTTPPARQARPPLPLPPPRASAVRPDPGPAALTPRPPGLTRAPPPDRLEAAQSTRRNRGTSMPDHGAAPGAAGSPRAEPQAGPNRLRPVRRRLRPRRPRTSAPPPSDQRHGPPRTPSRGVPPPPPVPGRPTLRRHRRPPTVPPQVGQPPRRRLLRAPGRGGRPRLAQHPGPAAEVPNGRRCSAGSPTASEAADPSPRPRKSRLPPTSDQRRSRPSNQPRPHPRVLPSNHPALRSGQTPPPRPDPPPGTSVRAPRPRLVPDPLHAPHPSRRRPSPGSPPPRHPRPTPPSRRQSARPPVLIAGPPAPRDPLPRLRSHPRPRRLPRRRLRPPPRRNGPPLRRQPPPRPSARRAPVPPPVPNGRPAPPDPPPDPLGDPPHPSRPGRNRHHRPDANLKSRRPASRTRPRTSPSPPAKI